MDFSGLVKLQLAGELCWGSFPMVPVAKEADVGIADGSAEGQQENET